MDCHCKFTVFIAGFEVSVRRSWRGRTTAVDELIAGNSTTTITIIIITTTIVIIITIMITIVDVSRGSGQRVSSCGK